MDRSQDATDFLAPLLQALAESLDVRAIFQAISAEAKRVIPHDFLMLGLVGEDGLIDVMALSGDLPGGGRALRFPEELRPLLDTDGFVNNDCRLSEDGATIRGFLRPGGGEEGREVDFSSQPFYAQLLQRGWRSFMRMRVRSRGEVRGGLIFCSTYPRAFTPEEFAKARMIAHCVALAVSHQRLADAERRSVAERERANRLEVRVQRLTDELEAQGRHRVLGTSASWRGVLSQATKVAATEATVLLYGESGTGKEVVARFVHRGSPRAEGPFVALNCAALPEQLLESELFGHERGAFTGALSARAGKIEQAASGVLFLDEVGEMSPAVQAKFLRVLQEREFQRVGGSRTQRADVRVLAATNRDLKSAISQGSFREDLYYRLAVFEMTLPPLRERTDDIPVLVEAFLEEIGHSIGRPAAGLNAEARDRLAAYAWPGNVRELRNAIERAVILCEGGTITPEHLPLGIGAAPPDGAAPKRLDETEREMILRALDKAGQNKSKAARLLGLTRAQLRSRLEKYAISTSD